MEDYLDLDSKSAVTIFAYVDLLRDNPLEELGMVDLENHVSEAIWKLFDVTRAEAAERLGVNEVDLLLTDARVLGVKIDGNEVVNPEGFTGKKLEVLLSITMVRRDKFAEASYLYEGGAVRAFLLARKNKLKEAFYVEVSDSSVDVFHINPSRIAHATGFEWGRENIHKSLQEELGVEDEAARKLYDVYISELVSPHVTRKFDRMIDEVFRELVDGVVVCLKANVSSRRKLPPIYFKSSFPVPNKIYKKRFAVGTRRFSFIPVEPEYDIVEFIGEEIHSIYKELNQLAQRRIKWLMPNGQ